MSFKSPKEITSMQDLRVQIDALDRELIERLAFRQAHIDRAAELKPAENLPARIETRVNDVLDKVSATAKDVGFDADLAREMWAMMIEAMIAREELKLGPSSAQENV